MTFEQFMNKYYGNIQPCTDVWLKYSQIWDAAEREDYVANMETYVNLTDAAYQSKRAKLKKAMTHWIGKFMIVKAENNKLRSVNKAITKRNTELQDYMVKHEVGKLVKRIGAGDINTVEKDVILYPLELQSPVHDKEPIKC